MDVHRSRFVPYPTSSISALAFSRSNDIGHSQASPALRLAVGRSNGSIEIWNPQDGLWMQEAIFPGDGRSIDGVTWTQDPDDTDADGNVMPGQQRLFSIASSPSVTEWDLSTSIAKRNSTGNFSEVWCFTAQPRRQLERGQEKGQRAQDVVAGCGDGTLVLLSTEDGDLQFKRFLARVSGRRAGCLCVTYQNADRVVAGFQDSMIRIYNTKNGMLLRTMSLGVAAPQAPKNALVWQVRCLPNGDIVSADSNGEVKFWDGKTYSLSQRVLGHDTDCLDLVTSFDGRTILSGSMEGKLGVYRQSKDGDRRTWAQSNQRRIHKGEVKAMTAFDGKHMSVTVSGGNDIAPIVTPLRNFGKENQRTLPSLPQDPPVTSAPKARLLVSWWEKTIQIWRVAKQSDVEATFRPEKPRKLVARINLKTNHSVRSVSISSDGRLLAVSTSKDIKVFQLRRRLDSDSLAIRKLNVPDDIMTSGARLLSFSPNGKWLAYVTPESEVWIARLTADLKSPKRVAFVHKATELDRQHRKALIASAFKEYDRTITRLAFSLDSLVLVAGDLSGYLDSWVLEGNEDLTAPAVDVTRHDSKKDSDIESDSSSDSDSSDDDDDGLAVYFGQHWTDNPAGHLLPKLDATPLVMTFRPTRIDSSEHPLVNGNPAVHPTRHNPHAHSNELPHGSYRLWIMTSKHHIFEFNVLAGKLSDWSRRNPTSLLLGEFVKIRDRVMGAVWDTKGQQERIWLYGSTFVCMLNVGIDLDGGENAKITKKRTHQLEHDQADGVRKRRKLESGAGGKVDSAHEEGVSGIIQRYEDGARTEMDLNSTGGPTQDGDETDDDVALQLTRVPNDDDYGPLTRAVDVDATTTRKWWCTFKYRPILGIGALEGDLSADGETPLEVVIVERPLPEMRNES